MFKCSTTTALLAIGCINLQSQEQYLLVLVYRCKIVNDEDLLSEHASTCIITLPRYLITIQCHNCVYKACV